MGVCGSKPGRRRRQGFSSLPHPRTHIHTHEFVVAGWNIGLALTEAGAVFHQWEGRGDTLAKTTTYAVVRDGAARTTVYELRLPLAALGLKPGPVFGFTAVFFDDDDGTGRDYWMQVAGGLVGTPKSKVYPQFVLADQTQHQAIVDPATK